MVGGFPWIWGQVSLWWHLKEKKMGRGRGSLWPGVEPQCTQGLMLLLARVLSAVPHLQGRDAHLNGRQRKEEKQGGLGAFFYNTLEIEMEVPRLFYYYHYKRGFRYPVQSLLLSGLNEEVNVFNSA